MDIQARVLGIILEIQESPSSPGLSVKEIAERFVARHGEDFDRKVTPHWAGYIIRRKLELKTKRHREGYLIAASEHPNLAQLFEKYGS